MRFEFVCDLVFVIWKLKSVLPKLFAKKFLGIDIGAASIKMVELEDAGNKFALSNYGEIAADFSDDNDDFSSPRKKTMADFSSSEVAEMIQAVLLEAKIKTRQCTLSIPDFSTFFTSFFLPGMTQKEVAAAVMFEARQHIPLPIDTVTVDWQLIGGEPEKSDKLEIAVTAVPNEIVAKYKDIALKSKLQLVLMEAEAFGLMQALIPRQDARAICVIDIGVQSTVCSLIEQQILRYSHSFDRGLDYLFDEFGKRLPIDRATFLAAKKNHGFKMISLIEPDIKLEMQDILKEIFNPILREIEMSLKDYRQSSGIEPAKIILSGGGGAVLETKKQFEDYFKKETTIAAPFAGIDYPKEIEDEIKNIGPSYAVAAGMARRGFEFLKSAK